MLCFKLFILHWRPNRGESRRVENGRIKRRLLRKVMPVGHKYTQFLRLRSVQHSDTKSAKLLANISKYR